jgi:hypothetical protein
LHSAGAKRGGAELAISYMDFALADMFVSSTYKLDETGDRIVRIPGIPRPSNAKEDSKEQLERTQALAKYVEVL